MPESLILRKRNINILIGSRPKINSMDIQPTRVKIDTCPIKRVKCTKVLRVETDENLNWEKHTEYIISLVKYLRGLVR
jgi:sRNA-binding carbon storage regulator CsrA